METRTEWDSLGPIPVPQDKLWGAQTQRALLHFNISTETIPTELIWALAHVKQVCARVNAELGEIDPAVGQAIELVAQEVKDGLHLDQFPLRVWQSGSGTQTNMNMDEVLARRATGLLLAGGEPSAEIHPNDHVNRGQSSNDVFPTAVHVACALGVTQQLLPALSPLRESLIGKMAAFQHVIKIGRTHLQDAVPLTLGQELSGYEAQLAQAMTGLERALVPVYDLAIGGTAVGTGLNTHPQFGAKVAALLADSLSLPFKVAPNLFAAIATMDGLVGLHAALKVLAVALMKLANDLRWMSSGPRCGLGELTLPANEPGSSIMPGKVNPSQCEAMMMVCCQVLGNDNTVAIAGSGGNLELNTFKPLMAHCVLQSIRLLSHACQSFNAYCVKGLAANEERMRFLLDQSLMLVTALSPHMGYDQASKIAQHAHAQNISLREAAAQMGYDAAQFDQWVRPEKMVGH